MAAKMSSPSLSSSISISSSADSTADFAGFLVLLAGCFAGDAFAREFFLKQNGLFYSIAQHGSKGMTLADKLIYIHHKGDTQNYPFCRIKLVVKMSEHIT